MEDLLLSIQLCGVHILVVRNHW